MSAERETLLNTFLESISGLPSDVEYENEKFDPPTLTTPYMQVYHMAQRPEPMMLSGSGIEYSMMQVNIRGPLARHKTALQAAAELVQSSFAFMTSFAGTGEVTEVRSKPHIAGGFRDGDQWQIPVTIYLQTRPT